MEEKEKINIYTYTESIDEEKLGLDNNSRNALKNFKKITKERLKDIFDSRNIIEELKTQIQKDTKDGFYEDIPFANSMNNYIRAVDAFIKLRGLEVTQWNELLEEMIISLQAKPRVVESKAKIQRDEGETNKEHYSKIILFDMYKHIETPYTMKMMFDLVNTTLEEPMKTDSMMYMCRDFLIKKGLIELAKKVGVTDYFKLTQKAIEKIEGRA